MTHNKLKKIALSKSKVKAEYDAFRARVYVTS